MGRNGNGNCKKCGAKMRKDHLKRHWKTKHPGETPEKAPKEELNKCSGDNERPQSQEHDSQKRPIIDAA